MLFTKYMENRRGIFASLLILLVKFYRIFISPILPSSCRFTPTCSEYAIDAILKFGAFKGGKMAAKRICRCHPWGGEGFDPVINDGNKEENK